LTLQLCHQGLVSNSIDEGCINPGSIILCAVVPNVFNIITAPSRKFHMTGSQLVHDCGSSALNSIELLHVTLLASRIWRWLLDFWKICELLL